MRSITKRRRIEVFDTPSGLGRSHTVEVVEDHGHGKVRVRVWYGRATATGWEAWKDWDGYTFDTSRDQLRNKRIMSLYKDN
ncbi:hypothetical protein [Rhizobium sp. FKY42]|uniref:hypothetical protein n=1 Tax=Rhizobium sp. FKY42 TaxID=2562310 RepID=UPI0010C0017B|nr:hypothetical protein [Rhizobium sp. FKY42]